MSIIKFIFFFLCAVIKGLFTSTYKITFEKEEDNLWYVVFPGWPEKYHANLQMVAGSDKLLDYLLTKGRKVTLKVSTKPFNDCIHLKQVSSALLNGSWYSVNYKTFNRHIWICPVTLFVLGRYPKNLYIKPCN